MGFPIGSAGKNPSTAQELQQTCVPSQGLEDLLEKGPYSCLENLTDRGAWRVTVHGVAELDVTEAI